MNDFFPGDPALHVMGRSEEKPARVHAKQKQKPTATPVPFEARLKRDIQARMAKLKPQIDEIPRLEKALSALEALDSPPKKNKRKK